MKSRSIGTALLSAIFVFSTGLSMPSFANDRPLMKNGLVLTTKEAKELIATAKTPKDHLKLALYFNQQADKYEADAKDHDEMIEAYRNSQLGRLQASIEHCKFLAKSNRESAAAFREMAAEHERMAREAAAE